MHYDELIDYLFSLRHCSTKYGIDRMRLLVDQLGHPERKFPIIHVAGTNGKGTVCAMLESIYRAHGFKTGLFTSPHLVSVEERIQINRNFIPQKDLIAYGEYLKPIAKALGMYNPDDYPSFFEMINAIGFLYFGKNNVDIAIIETGLGGELDSTNVVKPLVSVITSISKDHTDILGDSMESITQAKAGIIKEKTPVVIGPMENVAENVIRQIAKEKSATVYSVEEVFGKILEGYPQSNLQGSCNRINAATAWLTANVIAENFPLDEEKVKNAIMQANWPGRWEATSIGGTQLIFDCSHNEAGAQTLVENLQTLIQKEKKKPIVIVGLVGEYKAASMMPLLAQYAHSFVLVKPKHKRAVDLDVLKDAIPSDFQGDVVSDCLEEIFLGALQNGNRTIVATGSIYLIGEIKERVYA